MKYSTLWATIKSIVVHLPGIVYYNKTMPFLFFFFFKEDEFKQYEYLLWFCTIT